MPLCVMCLLLTVPLVGLYSVIKASSDHTHLRLVLSLCFVVKFLVNRFYMEYIFVYGLLCFNLIRMFLHDDTLQ